MKERTHFPDEILEKIFSSITSNNDRGSISLVSKQWYQVERHTRHRVLISNCYSTTPDRMISRFPNMQSLMLKGRPKVYCGNDIQDNWDGNVLPWISELAWKCPFMEEFCFKRMVVTDQSLVMISRCFWKVKCLVLDSCHGFTTDGLASIATHCRHLEVLDLQNCTGSDTGKDWLGHFPVTFNSLVCLSFESLRARVNPQSLLKLVSQCPNLRILRLNKSVPFGMLHGILYMTPKLIDFGIGSSGPDFNLMTYYVFKDAVKKCHSLESLTLYSSFRGICLRAFHSQCSKLIELDLSAAKKVQAFYVIELLRKCSALQRIKVLGSIGDKGLQAIASSCKDLQELIVWPWNPIGLLEYSPVTEEGLFAIAKGCSKLHLLKYHCHRMTNAALIFAAGHWPNLTRFDLCLRSARDRDPTTLDSLDKGFGEIVYLCKRLKCLHLSGHLTGEIFLYIGMYAEQLETLSVVNAGASDESLHCVLNGCEKLRKLQVANYRFGDSLLRENAKRFEAMRYLWISHGNITMKSCKVLAKEAPALSIDVISPGARDEKDSDDLIKVDNLYLYPTTVGPGKDALNYNWIAK